MPADSDHVPSIDLPHSWRPLGTRVAATVFGGLLLAVCAATWIAFGPSDRARFTPLERATLIAIGLMLYACWFGLFRCRLTATEDGLTVVNGYRKHAFLWPQVLSVGLRRGAPWAHLDLSDGTTISVMGIQGSDGVRARAAVREVRALIATHAEHDDEEPGGTDAG